MYDFDAFLSHATPDKPRVRELRDELAARGLRCWLDEDELQPGRPWMEALINGIQSSRAIVVCGGSAGVGQWEAEEAQLALRQVKKDGRPLVPVVLPGAPATPPWPAFVDNRISVDCRAGWSEDALDRLYWGITGKKVGTVRPNGAKALAAGQGARQPVLPDPISDPTRRGLPSLPERVLTLRITGANPPYTLTPAWAAARSPVPERELRAVPAAWRLPGGPSKGELADWLWGPAGEPWRDTLFLAGFGAAQTAQPGPGLHEVRLRLDLPPALTNVAWESLLLPTPSDLPGWTLEWALPGELTDVHLPNPAQVLVLGKDEASAADTVQALIETLAPVWKSGTQSIAGVHNTEAFDHAVARGISVLLISAQDRGTVGIRKAIGKQTRALRTLLPPDAPDIPLVLVVGPAGTTQHPVEAPSGARALVELLGADPLADARTLLREIFEYGVDPVVAVARLAATQPGSARVYTRFAAWRTPLPVDPVHRYRPRERLDRRLAKGDAADLVRLLWSQANRRSAIAVAPGLPGQLAEQFGGQLEAHFKATLVNEHHLVERLEVVWGASDGELQSGLVDALEGPLHVRLGALQGQLCGALTDKRPTFLLDWGVFGGGAGRPFSQQHLRSFANFVNTTLHAACPPGLRLLHLLTVVAPEGRHPTVKRHAETVGADPALGNVYVRPLHAVGLVTEEDLRHFLQGPGNTNMGPTTPVAPVAAAIWRRAGGLPGAQDGAPPQREADFELCCRELVLALDHGWGALVAEGQALLQAAPDEVID